MPVAADNFHHSLLAEFSELVFRLSDAVTIGDKNVAGIELLGSLLVAHVVDQADHRSAAIQPRHAVVGAQQQRRQVPARRINKLVARALVVRQKERGVLLRLRAAKEVPVEQGENLARLLEELSAFQFRLAYAGIERTGQCTVAGADQL